MTTDEIMNISYNDINKCIDISLQDQYSRIVDFYMVDHATAKTPNIDGTAEQGDYSFNVDDATGISSGDACMIYQNTRSMQALVISVVSKTITINVPLEFTLSSNANIYFCAWNMVVNGSSTNRIFSLHPPVGVKWDITKLIFSMTASATMDDSKFGSLNALTKGIVLRVKNGIYKNIFSINDNGGFAERCYYADYPTKVPAGVYAFRCMRMFGGQHNDGVVVRLNGDSNDELQIIIQDNLSGGTLTKFACCAHGHVVED